MTKCKNQKKGEIGHLCTSCFGGGRRKIVETKLKSVPRQTLPALKTNDGGKYPVKKVKLIDALIDRGYKVKQLSIYQFRINNELDIYPVSGKFHNIKTQERGIVPCL